ncbi:MAG: hypothetical protein AAB951_01180 [Patescibacteria group bacterium]
MSRTGALILIGILILITPFSGLPEAIRTFLIVVFGVCVLGIGLSLRTHEANKTKTGVE